MRSVRCDARLTLRSGLMSAYSCMPDERDGVPPGPVLAISGHGPREWSASIKPRTGPGTRESRVATCDVRRATCDVRLATTSVQVHAVSYPRGSEVFESADGCIGDPQCTSKSTSTATGVDARRTGHAPGAEGQP